MPRKITIRKADDGWTVTKPAYGFARADEVIGPFPSQRAAWRFVERFAGLAGHATTERLTTPSGSWRSFKRSEIWHPVIR